MILWWWLEKIAVYLVAICSAPMLIMTIKVALMTLIWIDCAQRQIISELTTWASSILKAKLVWKGLLIVTFYIKTGNLLCFNKCTALTFLAMMWRYTSLVFLLTLVIIFCSKETFSDENVKHNFSSMAEAISHVEQYILKIKNASNTPSLAFGLAHKGKPIWKKSWGYSDLENQVFATVNTGYRLAR